MFSNIQVLVYLLAQTETQDMYVNGFAAHRECG